MHIVMIINKVDENDSVYGANICWIRSLARCVDFLTVIGMSVGSYTLPENTIVYTLQHEDRNNGRVNRFLRFEKIMLQALARKRIDGVFVHQAQVWGPLVAYCRLLRIPVVLFKAHGMLPGNMKFFLPFFDRVATTTPETFALDTPKKIAVGQGVDVAQFKKNAVTEVNSRNEGHPRIISVGRVSPIKGYHVLIEAASRLIYESALPLHFDIYGEPYVEGDKYYATQLSTYVKELNLGDRVIFHGPIPHSQLSGVLNRGTLFVNASVGKSALDRAVLEAMACERPVITSNEKFIELFGPYADLLYFQAGHTGQLAERVRALLTLNPGQRDEIGPFLRRVVVENHNVETLMSKIVEIIRSLRPRRVG